MSLYEYQQAHEVNRTADWGEDFYALVMVLMLNADTSNQGKLRAAWPHIWDELQQRYNAPRGLLAGESDGEGWRRDHAGNLFEPGGEMVRAV